MGNIKPDSKILVALSGGVDSSVAAALLKRAGYNVEGAYMRCWSEGPYCTASADEADAAKVAGVLEIPFRVFNFEKEYKKKVIDYFFAEYEAGRTPNPDVMCNKKIKFGLFLNKARKLGFDYIATGHYARISNEAELGPSDTEFLIQNGKKSPAFSLLTGTDGNKDQSYFLYMAAQDQLRYILFPLGSLKKSNVRELAKKFRLPTAERRESMGICFVGPARIKEFLMQKIKIRHGDIISVDGRLLGKHIGLAFSTIGQREGLGISETVPYYVVDKEVVTNTLIVAPFGHKALYRRRFLTDRPHWIKKEPALPLKAAIRLRHRAPTVKGTIKKSVRNTLEVVLDKQERAITPGQSAVFYLEDKVLGGAVINRVLLHSATTAWTKSNRLIYK